MSYRCQVCRDIVAHGHQQRKHILKRRDGTIAREIAVCDECGDSLAAGLSLANLLLLVEGLERMTDRETAIADEPIPYSPMPTVPVSFYTNGGTRPNDHTPLKAKPVCDVCGMPADDGQVTATTTLCPRHAKGKGTTAKKSRKR